MVKLTTINILEQPRALVTAVLTRPWLAGILACIIFSAIFGAWLTKFLGVQPETLPQVAAVFPEKLDTTIFDDLRFKTLRSFGSRPTPTFGQTRDIFQNLLTPETPPLP